MASYADTIRFNFLYIDKYAFGRTWFFPESKIPYCMLRYILSGSAEFCIDGSVFQVRKDHVIYIPEGCKLSCKALDDDFTFISIRFSASVYYEGADFLHENFNLNRITEGNDSIKELFMQIYKWVHADSPAKVFWVRGNLELLIASIIQENQAESNSFDSENPSGLDYTLEQIRRRVNKSRVVDDPRIQVVTDYMILHPMEEYSAKKMSQMSELAETTFRRRFKVQTGKTPHEFLRDLRINTAARKLLISNEQVSIIAYEVGFSDPNHFIRVFKDVFGLTPNQYRKTSKG